tara:strand:+ start:955 stop:2184 length:1230 start_codon:yes stop_codon:yes gene_type:complete
MSIAIVNGKLLDEQNKINVRNLLIQGKKITGVGYIPDEDEGALDVFDVSQSMILPSTFDFFSMPEVGDIVKYTHRIQSKGMLHLAYLPNDASCALDRPEDIARMIDQLGENAERVSFVACASKANGPNELSELSMLISAGAKAIYFGRIIENETLFKQALTYVDMIGVPIVFGPMTKMEKNGAHLNAGATSFEIGIRGESEDDELSSVQYVLSMLQSHPNIPIHFQSISSIAALQLIHSMKQHRSNLSVGVSPFHLVFSDEYLSHYNQRLKFNPPLRSSETMRLLRESLTNGMVDHLTSLHHPTLGDSQEKSFFDHSFGSETIDSFFQVVSHCLVESQLSLDYYHSLLSCPQSLSLVQPLVLGLNSNASFIVLKAVAESLQSHVLFGDIEFELQGGVQVIMKDGELMNT